MCGIYGCWNLDGAAVNVGRVERATTSIRHRGPDDEGYLLVDTAAGRVRHLGGRDTDPRLALPPLSAAGAEPADLALGFRRLAILDLSPAGHQPMASADGRFWIVFNGEVYNFAELREELRGAGHTFRSDCDTEVILAAYRAWGERCLPRFNGMWALAIWDTRERSLFLARDRFGVKPLFYTDAPGRFAFASEIKALVGGHGIPFRPRARAVYDYLAVGLLPSPRAGDTFFEGVRALPPGHLLRVSRDGSRAERWYTLPERRAVRPTDVGAAVREYGELLTDAVRLRLRSDVAVGSCLSGGLDSSSIVCLANRMIGAEEGRVGAIGDRQKAFSAVYETDAAYNERVHIDRVLAATGAEANYTIPTLERLLADIEKVVWHQDEPFTSASIFAQWCVMERVRERGVVVLLDGQGADEALAGYRPFAIFIRSLLRTGQLGRAATELRALREVAGASPARLLAASMAAQLPSAVRTGIRRSQARGAIRGMRADFAGAHQASLPVPAHRDLQEHLTEQLSEGSLPHLLRFEDRNSMAFSLEARVPFVDFRLVEYAVTAPDTLRIRDGWTKWILRESMRGTVPEAILWRRDKVGFETPEPEWLRAWMRGDPGMFADGAASGAYLDLAEVRRLLDGWDGRAPGSRQVWRWINLELWLRTWARS